MIETEIIGLQEFGAKLGLRVSRLEGSLVRAMREIGMDMVAEVKANKLSGQVLRVQTGRLRRSITSKVKNEGGTVSAEVGTNVSYGLIHEFGDKARFSAKGMRGPFPQRAFLRPTLVEKEPQIKARVAKAIAEAIGA